MHIIVFASLELVSWLLVLSTILVFGMFNLQKVSILLILNLSFIFVFDFQTRGVLYTFPTHKRTLDLSSSFFGSKLGFI